MQPTARELIESIAVALDRQVTAHVDDKWAASVVRSAMQLLQHLAVRVDDEVTVLMEDNRDVNVVLESVRRRLAQTPRGRPLCSVIDSALALPEPVAHAASQLAARNEVYQAAVEKLLRDRQALEALPDGRLVRADLREYLQRRLKRERHLYFPAFTSVPF